MLLKELTWNALLIWPPIGLPYNEKLVNIVGKYRKW